MPRGFEVADVAGVKEVEDAVALDDALARRPLALQEGRELADGLDLGVSGPTMARRPRLERLLHDYETNPKPAPGENLTVPIHRATGPSIDCSEGSTGVLRRFRVKQVPQAVAQQVEAQDGDGNS